MIGKNYKPPDEKVMGAPTKYRPEYCQKILEYFDVQPYEMLKDRNGNDTKLPPDPPSIEGFANILGVKKQTIYNWAKKHKDFLDCLTLVRQKERSFIRYAGLASIYDSRFCSSVYASLRNESPKIHLCKTIRNKLSKIQEALVNDQITEARAEVMKNQVLAEATVTEISDLDQRMKKLEKKDESNKK